MDFLSLFFPDFLDGCEGINWKDPVYFRNAWRRCIVSADIRSTTCSAKVFSLAYPDLSRDE